jgi:hypothetical protein
MMTMVGYSRNESRRMACCLQTPTSVISPNVYKENLQVALQPIAEDASNKT